RCRIRIISCGSRRLTVKENKKDALATPDFMMGGRALDLAAVSTNRAIDVLADSAVQHCGAAAGVAAALERGVPFEQALNRAVPLARGVVAEEAHAALFNRDAALVDCALFAKRFEVPNDPLRDIVVRTPTGVTVVEAQLKYGAVDYVARE